MKASFAAPLAALTAACIAACGARAADAAAPVQHLGAMLPPGLHFVDTQHHRLATAELLQDGRPLVLVTTFFRCDTLCGTVAHGVLEALADSRLPPDDWRLVIVSVDPQDRPEDARALQTVYTDYAREARPAVFDNRRPALRLLVGDGAELARALGFEARADKAAPTPAARYAHAAGLAIVTPQGTISRYFFGVRFDPDALRLALVDASAGHIGTLADRLLLACAHVDERLGRHSAAILAALRWLGIAGSLALAGWIWRHRHPPKRSPR